MGGWIMNPFESVMKAKQLLRKEMHTHSSFVRTVARQRTVYTSLIITTQLDLLSALFVDYLFRHKPISGGMYYYSYFLSGKLRCREMS